MNKSKKIFLALGTVLTTLPAIATVISCGKTKSNYETYYDYKNFLKSISYTDKEIDRLLSTFSPSLVSRWKKTGGDYTFLSDYPDNNYVSVKDNIRVTPSFMDTLKSIGINEGFRFPYVKKNIEFDEISEFSITYPNNVYTGNYSGPHIAPSKFKNVNLPKTIFNRAIPEEDFMTMNQENWDFIGVLHFGSAFRGAILNPNTEFKNWEKYPISKICQGSFEDTKFPLTFKFSKNQVLAEEKNHSTDITMIDPLFGVRDDIRWLHHATFPVGYKMQSYYTNKILWGYFNLLQLNEVGLMWSNSLKGMGIIPTTASVLVPDNEWHVPKDVDRWNPKALSNEWRYYIGKKWRDSIN